MHNLLHNLCLYIACVLACALPVNILALLTGGMAKGHRITSPPVTAFCFICRSVRPVPRQPPFGGFHCLALVGFLEDVRIHSDLLLAALAVGLSEFMAGDSLFGGRPPHGPCYWCGVEAACWIRKVVAWGATCQQPAEPTRQYGDVLAIPIKS